MKRLMFLVSVLLLTTASVLADKKEVPLKPVVPADGKTKVPLDPLVRRTPTRPILCVVDMNQKTIESEAEIDVESINSGLSPKTISI